ncbi:MAG: hypothetical protein KDB27_02520 [Planctomycetales bacterium]|nr:hypothetical protein [Planctomycetales bacterium]
MNHNHISLSHHDDIPSQNEVAASHQNKPQQMVSFVQLDGSRTAFPYGHLCKLEFDGSSQITMTFMNDVVTIEGRGMDKLYANLRRQLQESVIVEREEHATGDVCASSMQILRIE